MKTDGRTDGIREGLAAVLRSPTVDTLWRFRADLFEARVPADAPVWTVVDEFRAFLDQLATSTSSREYSELASKLDIGAVGGVVLEHILEEPDSRALGLRLLTGALSEGLMVLATRQHVRAWEGELDSVYRGAAWYLYGELWRWTEHARPDLPIGERRRLLDTLFAPLQSEATGGFYKAVLLGLLFQVLLIGQALDSSKPF
jgi:hypothetical protein